MLLPRRPLPVIVRIFDVETTLDRGRTRTTLKFRLTTRTRKEKTLMIKSEPVNREQTGVR
jgi:hypothetical protein